MKIDIDTHIHTSVSKCCTDPAHTVAELAALLASRGYRLIAITDHVWANAAIRPNNWYSMHPPEALLRQIEEIHSSTYPLKVLASCEADMRAPGEFGITPDLREVLDMVMLASDHFQLRDFVRQPSIVTPENLAREMLEFFCSAIRSGLPDILAHPLYLSSYDEFYDQALSTISDSELYDVLSLASEHGVGLEINGCVLANSVIKKRFNLDSMFRVFAIAKSAGCKFTFGTDAHKISDLDFCSLIKDFADRLGIIENDLHPLVRL